MAEPASDPADARGPDEDPASKEPSLVLVLSDSGQKNLAGFVQLAASKTRGHLVWKAPGLDGDTDQGHVFKLVAELAERAHLVLVNVGHANANVAFELGYCLSKNLPVALIRDTSDRPKWTEQWPFASYLVKEVSGRRDLIDLATVVETTSKKAGRPSGPRRYIRIDEHPRPGSSGLLLAPPDYLGADYADELLEAFPGRLYRPCRPDGPADQAWSWDDAHEVLAGVGAVVWIFCQPSPTDSDGRDGISNTSNAAIAGYLHGLHGKDGKKARLGFFQRTEDAEQRSLIDVADRRVRFKSPDHLVEQVREFLDGPKPRVEVTFDARTAYLEWVQREHRKLPSIFAERFEEGVRVRLSFQERAFERLGRPGSRGEGLSLHRSLPLRALVALENTEDDAVTRRWVVLGDPGSGKSTACRLLAHELATEALTDPASDLTLPVYLHVAELVDGGRGPRAAVLAQCVHGLDLIADGPKREALERFLEERFTARGGVVLLLDGLDELEAAKRAELRKHLETWEAELSQVVFVVTSRKAGFEGLGERFREVEIQELTDGQVEELLTRWLGADLGTEVLRRLRGRRDLATLCRTPLLLALLARAAASARARQAKQEGGREPALLPRTRGDLYRAAIRDLLERGHGEGPPKGVVSTDWALRVLHPLCLDLQQENRESWPLDDLVEKLVALPERHRKQDAALAKYLGDRWIDERAFLTDVHEGSGILGPYGGPEDGWRFLHRALREYLAAEALNRLKPKDQEKLVKEMKDVPRWGEVFGHFCGMGGADAARGRVELLVERSPQLALATLPHVEDLDWRAALQILREIPKEWGLLDPRELAWDGDELLALARGWQTAGATVSEILARIEGLYGEVETLEQMAFVVYARDRYARDQGLEEVATAELRELLHARFRSGVPVEPAWREISGTPPDRPFCMGARPDEEGADADEEPRHEILLGSFHLAETVVTEAHFERFDPNRQARDPNLPVTDVSWWVAWLYCLWLGGRLPTEAEWEYACRGPRERETRYWAGDEESDLARVGWYRANSQLRLHSAHEEPEDSPGHPWGLKNLHGNVWEWVTDWFGAYPETSPEHPLADPRGPEEGVERVLRGGSCWDVAAWCRSAARFRFLPADRGGSIGFRVARSTPQPRSSVGDRS